MVAGRVVFRVVNEMEFLRILELDGRAYRSSTKIKNKTMYLRSSVRLGDLEG